VRPKGPLVGLHLSGVRIPEPVFSVAVETATATQQKALEDAMDILLREDPSLHMEEDEGSGQIVLKGVGELHLQIVCDRYSPRPPPLPKS
jgi:elongation factor G